MIKKRGFKIFDYWANQMTPTDYAGHFHVRNTTARSKKSECRDFRCSATSSRREVKVHV